MISNGGVVNRRTKVFEFADDETTSYAILSHRWTQEVDYEEIVDLAKMEKDEQNEVRQRLGYQKILASCEQAKKNKIEWLWVDTCCIDKRSSAELSEAINSMYRWYENSGVCYAYLHDVCSSFPCQASGEMYPNFKGWPEWFSRGWTLQEMIAPRNVQFFNEGWESIGNKKMLAHTLSRITGVPSHILADGFSSNRPCVAQTISWAANRTTTRVEDRAYSLLGLLDVNMPMLYGEGRKAFHRLQLEIIRASNDQSIFAWDCDADFNERTGTLYEWGLEWDCKSNLTSGGRSGSVLADDPSSFRGCDEMEVMDRDKFVRSLKVSSQKERCARSRKIDLGYSPSPIAASKFRCPFVPILTLAHSLRLGCRAAVVRNRGQCPSHWLCGNPIIIDILCRFHLPQKKPYSSVNSTSGIKTRIIATPHSKSMTLQSLRRVLLNAGRTHLNLQQAHSR